MKRLCFCVAFALATGVAMADDVAWRYDTSNRHPVPPVTQVAAMAGLDAQARGLGYSAPATVDKWYWTRAWSNVYRINLTLPALFIFIR